MPFSPQPRKKGNPVPQDGTKKPSCGHPVPRKDCAKCVAETATPPKVVDLPTEKLKITRLRDSISDKAVTDKRFAEKAAVILSLWISKKR